MMTASTNVPEIELRSPGVMRDDLGKVRLSKSNYMCA